MNRRTSIAVGLLTVISVWACTDSTNPNADTVRDPSDVEVITLDPTAPGLETDSVSFYAVAGEDREVEIYFDSAGVRTDRLLRFEVDEDALDRRPDGSKFRNGDSVLITIRVSDPQTLQFDFQPSGLKFSRNEPAVLTVGYGRALTAVTAPTPVFRDPGHGGGGHDETDLAIWLQETLNSSYLKLDSDVDTGDKEIEAEISGFSRYAVAY